jgi:hypothetical protein
MVAYKLDHALVPKIHLKKNNGKASAKDSTDDQASTREEAKMVTASKHPQGNDHGTHGSKASPREMANDNNGKASAKEINHGQLLTVVNVNNI